MTEAVRDRELKEGKVYDETEDSRKTKEKRRRDVKLNLDERQRIRSELARSLAGSLFLVSREAKDLKLVIREERIVGSGGQQNANDSAILAGGEAEVYQNSVDLGLGEAWSKG